MPTLPLTVNAASVPTLVRLLAVTPEARVVPERSLALTFLPSVPS